MEGLAAAEGGPDGVRQRRGVDEAGMQRPNHAERPRAGGPQLPKHSYWLDIWLFILFDLVLFFFVYLLP
ncbi:uncharacterized protein C4orf3 homolog [Talpa occidentalis]|uniref:uncharacterized protein C4orf3 homolog n=1 Tax=Talpa occidentalis TaxID=50954 RepID=UPI0018900DB0|nr:uncharacterized protein C4orf3 homolog [Talpa occidentalis]